MFGSGCECTVSRDSIVVRFMQQGLATPLAEYVLSTTNELHGKVTIISTFPLILNKFW